MKRMNVSETNLSVGERIKEHTTKFANNLWSGRTSLKDMIRTRFGSIFCAGMTNCCLAKYLGQHTLPSIGMAVHATFEIFTTHFVKSPRTRRIPTANYRSGSPLDKNRQLRTGEKFGLRT